MWKKSFEIENDPNGPGDGGHFRLLKDCYFMVNTDSTGEKNKKNDIEAYVEIWPMSGLECPSGSCLIAID